MTTIRRVARKGLGTAAACAALFVGCTTATIPSSANVDWLIGAWDWHTHSRFEFARDGGGIAWTMKRTRVLSANPRWGEKAAVEVVGKVASVTDEGVELFGTYERSDSQALVGRRFRMWLKRDGTDVLRGEMVGAGNEPVPVIIRKASQP